MSFNTRGGTYGFLVEFADGSKLDEGSVVWDDIPKDRPIKFLRFVHLRTQAVLFTLEDFSHYFFMNEAAQAATLYGSGGGTQRDPSHTAKIFGGIRRDGTVSEIRVSFPPGSLPKATLSKPYPNEEFIHSHAVFRPTFIAVPGKLYG
ncbi:hypothetical protein KW797_01920 [Candidatus Parcubacteria bacterium]|nr:hypothetical protein [Candidatus Parcubacteria bacterium]